MGIEPYIEGKQPKETPSARTPMNTSAVDPYREGVFLSLDKYKNLKVSARGSFNGEIEAEQINFGNVKFVRIEEDTVFFEDIKAVRPGGHYLRQRNTRSAARSHEFVQPALVDRSPFEQWVELGRPDLYDKAKVKVEEILASPPKNTLPDDVIAKLEDIMRKADDVLT